MRYIVRISTVLTLTLMLLVLDAGQGSRYVSAHPMGELTINHYSRIEFTRDQVRIHYVVDYAELSTLEQIRLIDGTTESNVDGADLDGYLDESVPKLADGLDFTVEDQPLELTVEDRHAEFLPGNWGMYLLRVEVTFVADLPVAITDNEVTGRYLVRNHPGRIGWHEVVMPPGDGVAVLETNALREDVSRELRDYPDADAQEPLQIYDVTFLLGPGEDRATDGDALSGASEITPGGPSALRRVTNSVERFVDIEGGTPLAVTLTVLASFVWGALHALSPGHGKAVVGAYLIGSRGTPKHAAFLGLTVTATHTAGIFALGFVTLALSHLILPDTLYPWLSVVSGVLVILIGASIGYRRLKAYRSTGVAGDHGHHHHHDHDGHDHHHSHHHVHPHHGHGDCGSHPHSHHHGHSHLPPGADGSEVTWRSLLALGVSGGMVPCPSALVLLLGAISLGQLEFGIVLVVFFSLGLAGVLTAIGLAMVYMRSVFDRYTFETRVPGVLPILSSAAIAIAGVLIVAGAIGQTGIS